jgi:hypothetical protein
MALRYFVGLDLGQAADFTALVVLERRRLHHQDPPAERQPPYQLRHAQRWQLGTPYPAIVADVVELMKKDPLPGCLLVVDQTGVGRPVVDLFTAALARDRSTCRFLPVTITAGRTVNAGDQGGLCVPKKDLVGTLQALLSTRRLEIAAGLPEARVLVKELQNFRVKITPAAHETFEAWREGDHDDLVLATALPAWAGEQALPGEGQPPPRLQRIQLGSRGRPASGEPTPSHTMVL